MESEASAAEIPRADGRMLALVFAAATLPFLAALPYGFVPGWDDDRYILDNPWLGGLGLGKMAGIFLQPYYFNYHPLTLLGYQIEYAVWGAWAPGFRATNILLHGAAAAGVAWLAGLLGAGRVAAALAALLFAWHPLRAESVVWVSERKDVLCGALVIVATGLWRRGSVGASGAAFGAALLAKAAAIPFAAAAVVHDALFARDRMRGRLPIYGALAVASLAAAYANMQAQTGALNAGLPLGERLWMALYAPAHYLIHTVAPTGLSAFYPLELRPSASSGGRIAGLLVCAGALGLAIGTVRRAPTLSFGLWSAALFLGPVSGIVGFGGAWAADRYSYIPAALLSASLAPVAEAWLRRRGCAKPGAAVATAALVALAGATLATLPRWSSSRALWEATLAEFPESLEARRNLASTLSQLANEARDPSEATQLREQALRTFPADGKALIARCDALAAAGDRAGIAAVLESALRVPGIADSTRRWAHARLGFEARDAGNAAEAERRFDAAFAPPPVGLATVQDLVFVAWYAEQAGRAAVAEALYAEALRREPYHPGALEGLAFICIAGNRPAEALPLLERAVEARPGDAALRNNLEVLRRSLAAPR